MSIVFKSDNLDFVKVNKCFINDYLAMINDPIIQDFVSIEKKCYDYDSEIEWIKYNIENDNTVYTIVDKSGVFVGTIDFKNIKSNSAEMGICIIPSFQDKHYGTEAIKRFIEYGFNDLGFEVIFLKVFSHNNRAIHCYKNVGFVPYDIVKNVKKSNGKDVDEIYMKIKKF